MAWLSMKAVSNAKNENRAFSKKGRIQYSDAPGLLTPPLSGKVRLPRLHSLVMPAA
jgi:hypothetical protein